MKSVIATLIAVLSLSACAALSSKAAPEVAKAVNKYCAEPYQERLLLRKTVNDMTKPNSVKVTCEGDPNE